MYKLWFIKQNPSTWKTQVILVQKDLGYIEISITYLYSSTK